MPDKDGKLSLNEKEAVAAWLGITAKQWGLLLIGLGIMILLGLPYLAPQTERDQLVEASGILHDKYLSRSRSKKTGSTRETLYFYIDEDYYEIKPYGLNKRYGLYDVEGRRMSVPDSLNNGDQVLVLWDPENSGRSRTVAEIWLGEEQILSYESYKDHLGRWNIVVILIGVVTILCGILWLWLLRKYTVDEPRSKV